MKGQGRPAKKKLKNDAESSTLSKIIVIILFVAVFVFFSWMYVAQYF